MSCHPPSDAALASNTCSLVSYLRPSTIFVNARCAGKRSKKASAGSDGEEAEGSDQEGAEAAVGSGGSRRRAAAADDDEDDDSDREVRLAFVL